VSGRRESAVMPRRITVNGVDRALPADGSLAAVLDEVGLTGRPVAVEVNGAVVSRERFVERSLQGGERIEIVTFVGGG